MDQSLVSVGSCVPPGPEQPIVFVRSDSVVEQGLRALPLTVKSREELSQCLSNPARRLTAVRRA
jgi:hypothetical protein